MLIVTQIYTELGQSDICGLTRLNWAWLWFPSFRTAAAQTERSEADGARALALVPRSSGQGNTCLHILLLLSLSTDLWNRRSRDVVCEPAAGAVRMEAVGHGAAQTTRAGGPSCTGLQRPAAEGRRDEHPHVRCSHERAHNEPNAAQPGAGGCGLTLCPVRR